MSDHQRTTALRAELADASSPPAPTQLQILQRNEEDIEILRMEGASFAAVMRMLKARGEDVNEPAMRRAYHRACGKWRREDAPVKAADKAGEDIADTDVSPAIDPAAATDATTKTHGPRFLLMDTRHKSPWVEDHE